MMFPETAQFNERVVHARTASTSTYRTRLTVAMTSPLPKVMTNLSKSNPSTKTNSSSTGGMAIFHLIIATSPNVTFVVVATERCLEPSGHLPLKTLKRIKSSVRHLVIPFLCRHMRIRNRYCLTGQTDQ